MFYDQLSERFVNGGTGSPDLSLGVGRESANDDKAAGAGAFRYGGLGY